MLGFPRFLGTLQRFSDHARIADVRQLAKRLNLSSWAIYQAVKDGTLPARRLRPRGRLYFSEPEVMEALKPDPLIRELLDQARAAVGAV
jgi:excisionase family DNA binding protein